MLCIPITGICHRLGNVRREKEKWKKSKHWGTGLSCWAPKWQSHSVISLQHLQGCEG